MNMIRKAVYRWASITLISSAVVSPLANSQEQTAQDAPLPFKDLRLFTAIFERIRNAYVEPISDEELLQSAIKGMLRDLDPHSAYLDTEAFGSLQENTQGEFSGVGLEIGTENGFVTVVTPIDDSPAFNAGIEAGDVILELDGSPIRGISVIEAAKRMRGRVGTDVTFTILRKGIEEPFDVTVTRGVIQLSSVRNRVIDEYYGYLRISQFQANTGKDFKTAIEQLYKKQPNLKGIVLDLRNNPGGVLQASVEVVDAFVDSGLIVYTEGRLSQSNQSFSATAGDMTNGLPVIVLINGGSASASEIVAGALQDSQRAVIMGTRSFGKGSVQSIMPVDDDKAIKLTTARYFTPNGRSIQAQGIEPDIVVERATITRIEQSEGLKESDLSGHLSNKSDGELIEQASSDIKIEDNQLFEAVNLLKGLAIYAKNG